MLFYLSVISISSFLALFCFLSEATPTRRNIVSRADISIGSVSHTGNGCPSTHNVEVTFARNTSDLLISYYGLYVYSVTNTSVPFTIRECDLRFNINHPAGWALGVEESTMRGYYFLDTRHTGNFTSELSYGITNLPKFESTYEGPQNSEYNFWPWGWGAVNFTGCPTSTHTEFRVKHALSVENGPDHRDRMSIYEQTIKTHWDPCPPRS